MASAATYQLSDEQLRQYFFDGCLLISDFLTAEETKQLQEWTDELESIARTMPYAQLLASTGVSKHLEAIEQADGTQKKEICRIEHFVPFHEGWRSLSNRIASLIGQLFDDNQAAKLYKEKINFKRPGGMGYAPHYDGPSPAAMGLAQTFITAQVAVDDQTPENGCIMGVFPRYDYPDDLEESLIPPKADGDPEADGRAGAIRPEIAAELPWQFLPCPAGSIFLFNHWFPHYSEGNKTAKTRRTAYLLYNAATEGDHYEEHTKRILAARDKFAQSPAVSQEEQDRLADLLALQSLTSHP